MRFYKFLILIPFFIFQTVTGQVNTNIRISGKVADKETKQPLEYATVSIISRQTGKTVNGTITDIHGSFGISDIPFGIYKVEIDYIGYEKITFDSVNINNIRPAFSTGTVYLPSATHSLQGVTVSADKPVIENKIDKIVYNAANDITSQGGQAIDVLKKVPQVSVDIDGNVELQGNSNIRFLINGKPSSVFGNNVSDALASIPASQIKSVEAITNPGAKYDSQGTGGIINIILQDNKMKGVNGNFNLSAGTRMENGSANLNIRRNNFGVNAFFSGNAQLKSESPFTQQRTTTDFVGNEQTSLVQTGTSSFVRNGYRSGLGFDWTLSKNDNLTGSVGYNHFGNVSHGPTNQEQVIQDLSNNILSDILTLRNSDSHMSVSSIDWSLDYKKKFRKEGQELDILYSASNGRPNSSYMQTQTYLGESSPYTGTSSSNPGTDNQTNISVDYAHPVNEKITFETGAKTTFQTIQSNTISSLFSTTNDSFVADPLQTYSLKYNMKIYAGYLSASFPLFNYLVVKAGARYEYTNVSIDYPGTTIPSYGTFVPSVVFTHNINKKNSLKLAYSKRIERPGYRNLNPFYNLSDPYNISTGNPLLKPEVGNNIELGYSSSFAKGGNIYVALIERINTQDLKQLTAFYPTYIIGDSTYANVSVTNTQNIGREYNTGISLSGSYPLTPKLNLRGNMMITQRYSVNNLSGNQSTGIRTRVNLNATYQLPGDLVLELFGFYNAPFRNIQGKVPQFFIYNFAFRKLFWDKKASFGFTTTNPFGKYVNQLTTISTDNSLSTNLRKMPIRSFGVSFTYKFGKMEFKKGREENDNSQMMEEAGRN
jgi:ferric enterobactin receptor